MLATKYIVLIIKIVNKLLSFLLGLIILVSSARVLAISTDVMITEIQTESTASTSEEYIIITNTSTTPVDITGWHLQYFSAGVTSFATPTRNIELSGVLAADESYMAASSGYKITEAAVFFGATLSAAGGHVRLISGTGTTEQENDRVGWGSALLSETAPADLVVRGEAYKRQKITDAFIDTDNNKNDFLKPTTTTVPVSAVTNTNADVLITELLPNPASPATDADDEYIELYNNSDNSVLLAGYKLQTGLSYSYSYTFTNEVIQPFSYAVFYSLGTNLTLINTSGKARLLAPNGAMQSETSEYSNAASGASWQLYGETWDWTDLPTPNAQNIKPAVDANNTSSTSATKKAAASTGTAKSKSNAVKSATSTKSAKDSTALAKTSYSTPKSDGSKLPANPLVLAGVGVIAVGYMVYEYRHDFANKFRQLKRNRANSKKAGV